MDPSTGTFISMDSYAGTIYDPVSLHKYLYANANPVMNTDPSGYTSLGELATSIGQQVSKIASAVYNNRILRSLSGAITGAIIGGIDSGLGGNDIKQVFHDALMGAGIGAIGACFLPELLCLVTSCVPKLIALKGMSYLVLLSGGLGVAESLNEGNGKQALFRGILTLVSFIGFRATIKKLELYAVEGGSGYYQDANGRWHRPNGKFASNSEVGQPSASDHYLRRPYIRKSTIDGINSETVVNYNTGEIWDDISGKWVDPANVELGHRTNYEYWYLRDMAESQGMTQAQFNDFMNNSDFYAWQEIYSNRCHMLENPH